MMPNYSTGQKMEIILVATPLSLSGAVAAAVHFTNTRGLNERPNRTTMYSYVIPWKANLRYFLCGG